MESAIAASRDRSSAWRNSRKPASAHSTPEAVQGGTMSSFLNWMSRSRVPHDCASDSRRAGYIASGRILLRAFALGWFGHGGQAARSP